MMFKFIVAGLCLIPSLVLAENYYNKSEEGFSVSSEVLSPASTSFTLPADSYYPSDQVLNAQVLGVEVGGMGVSMGCDGLTLNNSLASLGQEVEMLVDYYSANALSLLLNYLVYSDPALYNLLNNNLDGFRSYIRGLAISCQQAREAGVKAYNDSIDPASGMKVASTVEQFEAEAMQRCRAKYGASAETYCIDTGPINDYFQDISLEYTADMNELLKDSQEASTNNDTGDSSATGSSSNTNGGNSSGESNGAGAQVNQNECDGDGSDATGCGGQTADVDVSNEKPPTKPTRRYSRNQAQLAILMNQYRPSAATMTVAPMIIPGVMPPEKMAEDETAGNDVRSRKFSGLIQEKQEDYADEIDTIVKAAVTGGDPQPAIDSQIDNVHKLQLNPATVLLLGRLLEQEEKLRANTGGEVAYTPYRSYVKELALLQAISWAEVIYYEMNGALGNAVTSGRSSQKFSPEFVTSYRGSMTTMRNEIDYMKAQHQGLKEQRELMKEIAAYVSQ